MRSLAIFSNVVAGAVLVSTTSPLSFAAANHYPRAMSQRWSPGPSCRCFPGDRCWPTAEQWSAFNQTVSGRLIATIPIGSPCHSSQYGAYNEAQCTELQSVWGEPETHIASSSSVMAPFAQNQSCDPFLPPTSQCVIGTYVQYSVKALEICDVQRTIAFAQQHNIRFAVRNTGHDYFGKSGGPGAIAIWTHFMQNTSVINYDADGYRGKALQIGAGTSAGQAQQVAHDNGLIVMGGDSPTVGLAGGYTQGGGHGPLASYIGLGADQALAWEVVTADGRQVTATPSQSSDLYWALSGGGGGTYAVVTALTVKAYPDVKVAGANMTFTNAGVSQETYYSVVETFLESLPPLLDAKAVAIFLMTNTTFVLQPVTAPTMDQATLQTYLNPTLNALKANNMTYTFYIQQYNTYLDSYNALNPEPQVTEYSIGGRLIPRSLTSTNSGMTQLTQALRFINNNGAVISGLCVDVANFGKAAANAVNPAWRTAFFDAVVGV